MAQAVFEEGPLEQYLRDAGEVLELLMPGVSLSILEEIDVHRYLDIEDDELEMEWRPHCVVVGLNLLETFLSSTRPTKLLNLFVEQFKYTIISSSLLSTSLSSNPHSSRSSLSPSALIPGQLPHDDHDHLLHLHLHHHHALASHEPAAADSHQQPPHYAYLSIAALATALLLSLGRRWLAILGLGAISFLAYHHLSTSETPCHDFTPTIHALDDLVEANRAWESTVQDSVQALEKEEANMLRSPTSAPAASSNALRVALHSTLQATRTQCDNVRQLFSALTSPSELSQLAEMYAPPSPVKSPLFLPASSEPVRPYSYPTPSRSKTAQGFAPMTPENKRATWNGSYTGLASAGSPTMFRTSRREKQHASRAPMQLSALFQGSASVGSPTPSTSASVSMPMTPFPTSPGPSLAQIAEDLHGLSVRNLPEQDHLIFGEEQGEGEDQEVVAPLFGSIALEMHKRQKREGLGAFELVSPPPRRSAVLTSPDMRSPPFYPSRSQRFSTFTPSSRFTTASSVHNRDPTQPPRHQHPLSVYALTQMLQAAISARRYTCSHLLALRFTDDEEEYWEDVRSVVELLTTTFADESARLGEALEEMERQYMRDSNPTPDISGEFQCNRAVGVGEWRDVSGGSSAGGAGSEGLGEEAARRMSSRRTASYDRVSFAPVPSHLSRFAAHVAAITSAMDDAREQLEECVAALKEDYASASGPSPLSSNVRQQRWSPTYRPLNLDGEEEGEGEEHRALVAYERLRRELGMALRECERGRQRLVDIVHPPPPPPDDDDPADLEDQLPDLSNARPIPSCEEGEGEGEEGLGLGFLMTPDLDPSDAPVDDVTSHLVMSDGLPAIGIEQVYEADTISVPFTREKSKLTREERISRMRERREKEGGLGVVLGGDAPPSEDQDQDQDVGRNGRSGKLEKWGPSGEVVQELKDVIWKVSERRRKMLERHHLHQHQHQPVLDGDESLVPSEQAQVALEAVS